MLDISSCTMSKEVVEKVLEEEKAQNTPRHGPQESKYQEAEFVIELRGVIVKDFATDESANAHTNNHMHQQATLKIWEKGCL